MKIFLLIFSFFVCISPVNKIFAQIDQGNIVPLAYASTPGNTVFVGPLGNTPRTYQLLINSDQLTAMVGQYVTAIAMRIPTSSTSAWPVSNVTYNSFDIYLAESVLPSQRRATFDSNIIGAKTQVRSGSLIIQANAYPSNENPNRFGTEIMFNTPYHYTGGNLLIEMRHTGFSGTARSIDAAGTSASGYGTSFSACWEGNYTATTGITGNFAVIQITSLITGIHNEPTIVDEFSLKQNYPNPFNPNTMISFTLPSNEFVTMKVYDKLGREVRTLINENKTAGAHSINFFGDDLASGIYFYKIQAGSFIETKKMMLVK